MSGAKLHEKNPRHPCVSMYCKTNPISAIYPVLTSLWVVFSGEKVEMVT